MPKVSVIIPTWNRALYLENTLAGFLNQTNRDFELIIIDDGSTDDTFEKVKKYESRLNIRYYFQEHKGLASARNKGIDESEGRYIINIDSDRIPSREFIDEHLKTLGAYPKCISIGSKHSLLSIYYNILMVNQSSIIKICLKNPEIIQRFQDSERVFEPERLVDDFENTIKTFYLFEQSDNRNRIRNIYTDYLDGFSFGWVLATGGNIAFDRDNSSGILFDENFKGWGVEDTDFSYQFFLKGCSFIFSKNAINYHQEHPRSPSEQQELKRNIKYFCYKYSLPVELCLWLRCSVEKNIDLEEANEILKILNNTAENKMKNDYQRFIKNKVISILSTF